MPSSYPPPSPRRGSYRSSSLYPQLHPAITATTTPNSPSTNHRAAPPALLLKVRQAIGTSPFLSPVQEARIQSWRESSASPPVVTPSGGSQTAREHEHGGRTDREGHGERRTSKVSRDGGGEETPRVPAPKIKSAPASISLSRDRVQVHGSYHTQQGVGVVAAGATGTPPSPRRGGKSGSKPASSLSQSTSTNTSSSRCRSCGNQYRKVEESCRPCSCGCETGSVPQGVLDEKSKERKENANSTSSSDHRKYTKKKAKGMRSYYSSKKSSNPEATITQHGLNPSTNASMTAFTSMPSNQSRPHVGFDTRGSGPTKATAPHPAMVGDGAHAYPQDDNGEQYNPALVETPKVPMPDRQKAMPPPPAKELPRRAGARDPISQN